jgi:hypothetical protein
MLLTIIATAVFFFICYLYWKSRTPIKAPTPRRRKALPHVQGPWAKGETERRAAR